MTELPSIIERLDKIRLQAVEPGTINPYDFENAVVDAYDDIKAELLRLQEERDQEAKARVQRGVQVTELKAVRDALLEALKAFVDAPTPEHITWEELCVDCGLKISVLGHADDCDWVKYTKARANARRVITNVEGTDEH